MNVHVFIFRYIKNVYHQCTLTLGIHYRIHSNRSRWCDDIAQTQDSFHKVCYNSHHTFARHTLYLGNCTIILKSIGVGFFFCIKYIRNIGSESNSYGIFFKAIVLYSKIVYVFFLYLININRYKIFPNLFEKTRGMWRKS